MSQFPFPEPQMPQFPNPFVRSQHTPGGIEVVSQGLPQPQPAIDPAQMLQALMMAKLKKEKRPDGGGLGNGAREPDRGGSSGREERGRPAQDMGQHGLTSYAGGFNQMGGPMRAGTYAPGPMGTVSGGNIPGGLVQQAPNNAVIAGAIGPSGASLGPSSQVPGQYSGAQVPGQYGSGGGDAWYNLPEWQRTQIMAEAMRRRT
jgi:hypothetical protein